MELAQLIKDLALMLVVAGAITVIFKRLRQPLVIGYILAGFLIGPELGKALGIDWLPSVADEDNVHVWSEIGIICLMFALGLEFSFHKLASVGKTAIITAVTEVSGMLLLGFAGGQLMGWGVLESFILGGVLAMSSTTIIIKVFEELKLKGKKFTEMVFGALIVEDIIGIFFMVFLSTFALTQSSGGGNMVGTIANLLFLLVLWLILGIYLIPTLLKKARNLMNDETLMIVSLGICFGLVWLFAEIGFSTALGSFIAGSILAGTMHAERIEHLVKPVKDLFGAVFFISVGMWLVPADLWTYAVPILIITAITIFGKLIFSSLGVLFSGQRLKTAVNCGASLAQIGEFSFIIIALAVGLGLVENFVYQIIISVSVITTLTTPFCIGNAEKIYNFVNRLLPKKASAYLNRYTSDTQAEHEKTNNWQRFLGKYFPSLLIYSVILIGVIELSLRFVYPFLIDFLPEAWPQIVAQIVTTLLALLLMAPFLRPLAYPRNKYFPILFIKNKANRLPLLFFSVLRIAIATFMVVYLAWRILDINMWWLALPALVVVFLISRSDGLLGRTLQIEARFLANFNEKQLSEHAGSPDGASVQNLLSEQLWIGKYLIGSGFAEAGSALSQLQWGRIYNVHVVKIISRKKHINIPEGGQKLHDGDVIFVLGLKEQLNNFQNILPLRYPGIKEQEPPVTLRSFIAEQDSEHEDQHLLCYAIDVNKNTPFAGKSVKDSGLRSKMNCLIIGIQRGNYPIVDPDARTIISNRDRVWVLGSQKMAGMLIREGLVQDDDAAGENPEADMRSSEMA
ncbi:MAG: cation:proton antiporter [Clostridiales bacterium]|nr:cation:proton antiporter [Clostridiales bacterium]